MDLRKEYKRGEVVSAIVTRYIDNEVDEEYQVIKKIGEAHLCPSTNYFNAGAYHEEDDSDIARQDIHEEGGEYELFSSVRLATNEEKIWIAACINENRYLTKDTALTRYSIIGKKSVKDY